MSATPLPSQSTSSSSSPSNSSPKNVSPTNLNPSSPSSRLNLHSTSSSVVRPRPHRSNQEALLPTGAIVQITGNNRTKQELVGRTGEVILATMLGGWHQVRLSPDYDNNSFHNQPTVRLQRNALRVLSLPDNPSNLVTISNSPKSDHRSSKPTTRPLNMQSPGITKQTHSSYHSNKHNQSNRSCVVIANLNSESLQRYRQTFNLKVPHDCTHEELVNAASKHFEKISVNEPQVIADFIARISKRPRNPSRSHHSQLN